MSKTNPEKPSISLLDTERVERGLGAGIRDALIRHKKLGHPVATIRDGKAVLIPADEIIITEEEERPSKAS